MRPLVSLRRLCSSSSSSPLRRGMSSLSAQEGVPLLSSALSSGPPPGSALHRGTVVWMHGLGDVAESFRALFDEYFTGMEAVRVLCLQAPTRPITVNGGMEAPGWYDIVSLDRRGVDAGQEDVDGIARSRARVHELLDAERKAAPGAPIVVGGFSQGGAMAINAGLTWEGGEVAGVVSCSGYVLQRAEIAGMRRGGNEQTPVLAYHGQVDDMVPVQFALAGYAELKEAGQVLEYSDEPGLGHSLSLAEMHRVQHFIHERLGLLESDEPRK